MASNIVSETIDSDYPVAGQDNDSQGFRDNFGIIKAGLATAGSEITDLQTNTAKLNTDNNFLSNKITNAEFQSVSSTFYPGGSISSSVEVNFTNGHYQTFTIENFDLTLSLTGFPAEKLSKITIELYGDNSDRTVTLTTSGGDIKTATASPGATKDSIVVNSSVNPHIIELWTYNAGVTVFGKYLGSFSTT